MKEVFTLIEEKKQEFSQLPFLMFLQDKNINPKDRMLWAPCVAPLSMSFADVWKYDLRKEPTDNKIQELINQHTYEDEDHWIWFLEDLKKLGFDSSLNFSDALRFIWGEETRKTRLVSHTVALCTFQADPIVVLAAIEAVEATFQIVISLTIPVIQELEKMTNQKYYYFGGHHSDVESNHAKDNLEIEEFIQSIELTDEQKIKAFEVVEKVFDAFTECMNEIMLYINTKRLLKSVISVA